MKGSLPEAKTPSRAVRLLNYLAANRALVSLLRHTPDGAKRWIKRQYWKLRLSSGSGVVAATALKQKYREAILWLLKKDPDGMGDYLEFGVFNGTSLTCMHSVVRELGVGNVRLFGFDSFEGLPNGAAVESGGLWKAGQFQLDYDYTRRWLNRHDVDWNRVFLIRGWFKDTLNEELIQKFNITKASVVMIDSDLYSSATEALTFCAPLIQTHTIIFLDNWFPLAARNMGEKKAFDEFLAKNPDLVVRDLGSYDENSKVFTVTRTRPVSDEDKPA